MYVPGRQSMKLDGSTIIWYYCGKPFYNDDVVMVRLKNGSEVKAMVKKGMLRCANSKGIVDRKSKTIPRSEVVDICLYLEAKEVKS